MQFALNILNSPDFLIMTTHFTKEELQAFLTPVIQKQKPIGLVPTMGALHSGHLTLVSRALEECDVVVVSIFVNPTQFNNAKDLEKYPRNLDHDIALLNQLSGNVVVFAPLPENLYGTNIQARSYNFGALGQFMEGQHRPGHFDGVATVVSLLFDAVGPDRAYFGEKDYQQLRIVETLVEVEQRSTKIIPCTIARNTGGLALSSRNQRLNETQLTQALLIPKMLEHARNKFDTASFERIKRDVVEAFDQDPELDLEYFEFADVESLVPTMSKDPQKKYRAFIAAHLAEVRLIDNLELN